MRFIYSFLFLCIALCASAQDASFLQKYAEKGDVEAMYKLGECYLGGTGGVNQNYSQAAMWITKAAKKKYIDAEVMLGVMNVYGYGMAVNYEQAWKLFNSAAKKNSSWAMFWISYLYKEGVYVSKDYSLYKYWLEKSATNGYAAAQSELGTLYFSGADAVNIKADGTTAVKWLQSAALQEDAQAQFYLGLCYRNGYGVQEDTKKGFDYLVQAANAGSSGAQCAVAESYMKGQDTEVNFNEALKYVKAAADQQHAYAYKLMGDYYYYGLGNISENNVTASEWYQKAYEGGNASAASQLAYMYLYGIGVNENNTKGFQLYKELADAEDVSGYAGLGMCYENGYGTTANLSTAVSFYKKASDENNNYSNRRLYSIYREGGLGVSKNEQQAIQYLRQAVDNGDENAMYSLGYEYLVGEIVHQDDDKALEYIKKSADEGYTFACAVLGTFYYDGEPLVKKDYEQAFNYLYQAAQDASRIGNDELTAEVYRDLAACYRFGRGTEVNHSNASYYTEQAAKYGDKKSVDAVKMLRK